jgi:hypothetical protein
MPCDRRLQSLPDARIAGAHVAADGALPAPNGRMYWFD